MPLRFLTTFLPMPSGSEAPRAVGTTPTEEAEGGRSEGKLSELNS